MSSKPSFYSYRSCGHFTPSTGGSCPKCDAALPRRTYQCLCGLRKCACVRLHAMESKEAMWKELERLKNIEIFESELRGRPRVLVHNPETDDIDICN